jgi:Fic family protein
LDSNAAERLVHIRGRHIQGTEIALRFRQETLDHEHILEGGAAPYYPLLLQLQTAFGSQAFGAKEISQSTGVSRATAHRQIDRLHRGGALVKLAFGDYTIAAVRH